MNPDFEIKFQELFLRRTDLIPFTKIAGFIKGKHSVPDRLSTSASFWAKSLSESDLRREMQEVYQLAKSEMKLRHDQWKKNLFEGGAGLECRYFSYTLSSDQDSEDPGKVKITRQVDLRASLAELPSAIDRLFPQVLEEIVLPIKGRVLFSDLIYPFEDLVDRRGGRLFDDEEKGLIEYHSACGTFDIAVRFLEREIVLRPKSKTNCLELLQKAQESLRFLCEN